ncbi:MAG TPA: hypothetical protein P5307_28985, partial [Pirellulaceae bacterium]|nr:hypothetical protein [Pirellulaceae bacterium]
RLRGGSRHLTAELLHQALLLLLDQVTLLWQGARTGDRAVTFLKPTTNSPSGTEGGAADKGGGQSAASTEDLF